MSNVVRARKLLMGLGLAALGLAAVHCGGGTDIAPSEPVIEGDGFAQASLGGTDFGRSTQIDAGLESVQNVVTSVSGETVSFGPEGFSRLAHGVLSSPIVTLTGPGGAPVYSQGVTAACVGDVPPCDYWLEDAATGLLQLRPGGPIPPAPATLLASYSYNERLLSLNVGLTFPDGQVVTLQVFHVAPGTPVPLTIQPVVGAAPAAPYPHAFNVALQTNLTTSGQRETYQAFDDPSNLLTVTKLDLSDESDPCVGGDFTVQMRAGGDPTPITLDASFEAPGC